MVIRVRTVAVSPMRYRSSFRSAVAWRAASLEGLDDEHAAATARARRGQHLRRRGIDLDLLLGHRRGHTQDLTRSRDRLGAVRAGEQAAVADAVEAIWPNVNEEAGDELASTTAHCCTRSPCAATARAGHKTAASLCSQRMTSDVDSQSKCSMCVHRHRGISRKCSKKSCEKSAILKDKLHFAAETSPISQL